MDIRFDGKTVVVIGGSTGIGAATVRAFANSGGNVYFTGIENPDSIDATSYSDGGFCEYHQLDVTNAKAISDFADYIQKNAGGCDVLFNNAGILTSNILHEVSMEEWTKVMAINVTGLFLCSKCFLPHMIKKNGGSIVNTSSMSGLFADYTFAAYNVSKGAVANMTRNMALDYVQYNIRVNAVAPGSVHTSMYENFASAVGGRDILDKGTNEVYPMGRIGKPEEIANAVLFLASDAASFITGQNLLVDGGITCWTGAQHQWDRVKEYYANK